MVHTISATPLDAVLVEQQGDHAEVWLRKNIETDWHDEPDGGSQQFWEADEVHGVMPAGTTVAEVEADFDRLWDRFEYSDREYAEHVGAVSADKLDTLEALIYYTAIMADIELPEVDDE